MMNGWDGGMTTAGWIFMVLFWVLLIVVILWAVTRLIPTRREAPDDRRRAEDDSPEAILARRLARGEIDPDSYDRLREKLREDRAPAGRGAS